MTFPLSKVSAFARLNGRPAVVVSDADGRAGWVFNESPGAWFPVNPADVLFSDDARPETADGFETMFPSSVIPDLPIKPVGAPDQEISQEAIDQALITSDGDEFDYYEAQREVDDAALKSTAKQHKPSSEQPDNSKQASRAKRSRPIFSEISRPRLMGVIAQGLAMAKLGQQKQQPTYRPTGEWPAPFSQEKFDQARARVEAADLAMVTNDKGEVVPVVSQ